VTDQSRRAETPTFLLEQPSLYEELGRGQRRARRAPVRATATELPSGQASDPSAPPASPAAATPPAMLATAARPVAPELAVASWDAVAGRTPPAGEEIAPAGGEATPAAPIPSSPPPDSAPAGPQAEAPARPADELPSEAVLAAEVDRIVRQPRGTALGTDAGQVMSGFLQQLGVGTMAEAAGSSPKPAPPPPVDLYGGYNLQRGDADATLRYGGSVRSAASGQVVPAAGTVPFVRQLQRDLAELGFAVVGADDGSFGRNVGWAVREFQIYASGAFVAQEAATPAAPAGYVDRLAQAPLPAAQRYGGPISGVVNAATRAAIQRWLANRWRCPVIVSAWTVDGTGNRVRLETENIWRHDQVTSTAPRMFVRDFSRYYRLPAHRNPDDLMVVGDYATYLNWSGPRSVPPAHTWPEGELLPESLVGVPLAGLTAAQRSTFKVVRAVSEVECLGFFDSVNAYDNAFVSVGPCHWTLGIVGTSAVEEGELCGYLAYLRHADPAAFRQAVGAFGVRIDEDWVQAGVADGRQLFDRGQRKYRGWVALQQEGGGYTRLAQTEADGDYFKTWHWFYRFVMAGRTIDGYRRRMWDMARIRLRDILATPWGPGVPAVPVTGGGTRPATIGDIYRSERAVGSILRWHVRYPAHVVSAGTAGGRLRAAFTRAAIPPTAGDPTQWSDAHEASLVDGIHAEAQALNDAGFTETMRNVRDWPRWAAAGAANPRRYVLDHGIGQLAVTRGSFNLDAGGLPPAP
jgi:hypothetical protein